MALASLGAQIWKFVPKNYNIQNLLTNLRKIFENRLQRNVSAVFAKCKQETLGLYKGYYTLKYYTFTFCHLTIVLKANTTIVRYILYLFVRRHIFPVQHQFPFFFLWLT